MPLRRFDRRHARPRLLDSRRRDAAAPGRGGARRRSRRASRICSSRAGGARALRRQRTDAVAAGAAGRRKRAARRVDRLLPREGRDGPVTLEIVDAAGKVVRTYSSTEPVFDPDPGKDMAAYDEVCKKTPTAAYCGLPLYWPAPQFIVSPKAGMHRFSWDLSSIRSSTGGSRFRPATKKRPARCPATPIRTTTCRGCRRAATRCG